MQELNRNSNYGAHISRSRRSQMMTKNDDISRRHTNPDNTVRSKILVRLPQFGDFQNDFWPKKSNFLAEKLF